VFQWLSSERTREIRRKASPKAVDGKGKEGRLRIKSRSTAGKGGRKKPPRQGGERHGGAYPGRDGVKTTLKVGMWGGGGGRAKGLFSMRIGEILGPEKKEARTRKEKTRRDTNSIRGEDPTEREPRGKDLGGVLQDSTSKKSLSVSPLQREKGVSLTKRGGRPNGRPSGGFDTPTESKTKSSIKPYSGGEAPGSS